MHDDFYENGFVTAAGLHFSGNAGMRISMTLRYLPSVLPLRSR